VIENGHIESDMILSSIRLMRQVIQRGVTVDSMCEAVWESEDCIGSITSLETRIWGIRPNI
jgi:hypothetical protein